MDVATAHMAFIFLSHFFSPGYDMSNWVSLFCWFWCTPSLQVGLCDLVIHTIVVMVNCGWRCPDSIEWKILPKNPFDQFSLFLNQCFSFFSFFFFFRSFFFLQLFFHNCISFFFFSFFFSFYFYPQKTLHFYATNQSVRFLLSGGIFRENLIHSGLTRLFLCIIEAWAILCIANFDLKSLPWYGVSFSFEKLQEIHMREAMNSYIL